MQGGLLLNACIAYLPIPFVADVVERVFITELDSRIEQPLLVGRDTLSVLDFLFSLLNGSGWLDVKRDSLAGQSFDKDLH